jgi:hypothetical protein
MRWNAASDLRREQRLAAMRAKSRARSSGYSYSASAAPVKGLEDRRAQSLSTSAVKSSVWVRTRSAYRYQ